MCEISPELARSLSGAPLPALGRDLALALAQLNRALARELGAFRAQNEKTAASLAQLEAGELK